jgi:PIN domain nuclease of toxin-antitoxin system
MTCLLDTHFIVWIVSESSRLKHYPWLEEYLPWSVSPVSLLEIQLLVEVGRRRIDNPAFMRQVMGDPRFALDDISLATLMQKAFELSWTRDPFDRLIVAHSLARRMPLCSVDERILGYHKNIVPELR